jgi:rare lipoprotein A
MNARALSLYPAATWPCVALLATSFALAIAPMARANEPGVSLRLSSGDSQIRYGERVRLSGTAGNRAGRVVALQHAPRGSGFRTLARTETNSLGRYALVHRPRFSGRYRALASRLGGSDSEWISVRARLRAGSRRHVLRRGRVVVRGALRPARARRKVLVQVRHRGRWRTVGRPRTTSLGRFRTAWHPRLLGRYRLRVRFLGDRLNRGILRPLRAVTVYRRALASWYGPGFFGNRTACGVILGPTTLGVAHRTLRCGTRVTLRYRGRSITVPVIDRGPYVPPRELDLTYAVKRYLRFSGVRILWSTR